MLKILSLALALALVPCVALAQNVTNPADAAVSGAYNTTTPTCTAGQFCRLQTDINGNLLIAPGGGGGSGTTTTVANSTIAVTNTFQAALAASTARKGCLFQNQGTHVMYAFFGAIGGATTAKSIQIQAGQTLSCNTGLIVLTDAFNITGTAGDAYVVNSQ